LKASSVKNSEKVRSRAGSISEKMKEMKKDNSSSSDIQTSNKESNSKDTMDSNRETLSNSNLQDSPRKENQLNSNSKGMELKEGKEGNNANNNIVNNNNNNIVNNNINLNKARSGSFAEPRKKEIKDNNNNNIEISNKTRSSSLSHSQQLKGKTKLVTSPDNKGTRMSSPRNIKIVESCIKKGIYRRFIK
jgi:hypothetical protein